MKSGSTRSIILTGVVIFISQFTFSQSMIEENIRNAQEAFARLDRTANYTEDLSYADMNILPVGIHKTVDNMDVTLAVSSARLYQNYQTFDAFLRIILPEQNNRQLFFGAKDIKMSYDGAIFGDASLTLLGDIEIPVSGGNIIFRLKGDFNSSSGQQGDLTYAAIDCKGLKSLGLSAEVEISPSICYTVDSNGDSIPNRKVIAQFQTRIEGWNDIMVNVSFPRFALRGLDGFAFMLEDAFFDFSDLRNFDEIQYPDNYQQYLPPSAVLWRGVYAKTIEVMLPPQFSTVDDRRLSFSAQNMIIDDNGVTGLFSANNLVSTGMGNMSGWAFSIDRFSLELEASRLISGSFDGLIGLPVSERVDLKYSGLIAENGTYVLQVNTLDSISFDMFNATAQLDPNSYIKLELKDRKFRPEALLHGQMGIRLTKDFVDKTTTAGGGESITELKGIAFRSLKLRTEAPYFQAEYIGYQGEVKLFNFPVSISDIGVSAQGDNRASLAMNVNMTLSDGSFTGSTRMEIGGRMEDGKIHRWKYDSFKVQDINIDATIAETFSLKGNLQILRDDPVYGDGFGGELTMDFDTGSPVGGLSVRVRGMFGRTDFRYWFMDGIASLSGTGIPVAPGFFLNGFGGGVTYRMQPQGLQSGNSTLSATSMTYIPNESSSLGIKAAASFYMGMQEAVNGEACFELSFNKSGGLDYAGFYGFAEFTKKIDGLQNFAEKVNSKYTQIIEKENEFVKNNSGLAEQLKRYKQYEPRQAANVLKDPAQFATVGIRAAVGIQFNFAQKSFDATADVYVNSAFIRGTASDNRAGYMLLHIDPEQWYVHLGTPSNRIGLRMGIGNIAAIEANAYLMTGTNIPAAPGVPPQVSNLLQESPENLDYMKDLNTIGAGKGFAFGSNLSINTGDLTFLILYANFAAGVGFDIMLKDYGDAQCSGRSGAVGIDGWYANGQAYGYMHGELGVKVNLWFVKGKFPIITTDFATLMQAKLPNPSSFKAYIAARASLLGGLVNVNCRFKLLVGEDCELVQPGASPLEMPLISDVSPGDSDSNINVFTAPQARFNMGIGKSIRVQDDEGEKTFRIQLKEFTVNDNGQSIAGELKWNSTSDAVSFCSHEVLPPEKQLTATATVIFEELRNGSWRTVYTSGKMAQESKTVSFTTGTAPDNIPVENIVYSYPVVSQKYYLKDESSKGYIQLRTGQRYLFPPELKNSIVIESANGNKEIIDFVYDDAQKRISYTLPQNISPGTAHTVNIVSLNREGTNMEAQTTTTDLMSGGNADDGSITVENRQASAEIRTDVWKVLLSYEFATSAYPTLQQKINAISKTAPVATVLSSDVLMFGYETAGMEPFDLAELTGTPQTGGKPLISAKATLEDYFYTAKIYPLVYQNYPVNGVFTVSRTDVATVGVPPVHALPVRADYLSRTEQGETAGLVRQRFPYSYNLPKVYKQDFTDLQNKVINSGLSVQNDMYMHFAEGVFPFISPGIYRIRLEYILPNGDKGTDAVFEYNNFVE